MQYETRLSAGHVIHFTLCNLFCVSGFLEPQLSPSLALSVCPGAPLPQAALCPAQPHSCPPEPCPCRVTSWHRQPLGHEEERWAVGTALSLTAGSTKGGEKPLVAPGRAEPWRWGAAVTPSVLSAAFSSEEMWVFQFL